jgi:hypothetical protein
MRSSRSGTRCSVMAPGHTAINSLSFSGHQLIHVAIAEALFNLTRGDGDVEKLGHGGDIFKVEE